MTQILPHQNLLFLKRKTVFPYLRKLSHFDHQKTKSVAFMVNDVLVTISLQIMEINFKDVIAYI